MTDTTSVWDGYNTHMIIVIVILACDIFEVISPKRYYSYGLVLHLQILWEVSGSPLSKLWGCKRLMVAYLVLVWGVLGNAKNCSWSFCLLDRSVRDQQKKKKKKGFGDLEVHSVVLNVLSLERNECMNFWRTGISIAQPKFLFMIVDSPIFIWANLV